MRLKLFGTDIYVSFLFAAVITIMLFFDRTGLVIPTIFAVLMHETGHLFAMWILSCNPKQIRLIPASVQIVRGLEAKQGGEIIIALCGPLVNLILSATFFINFLAYENDNSLSYAMLNLIIGVFNLLPVNGLDGGTILVNLLSCRMELNRSLFIVKTITFITGGLLLSGATFLLLAGKCNISLFLIAIYLIIMNLIKI